mgnify:CR=1 FL=1
MMKRIIPLLILIIAIFCIWYFYPCFAFKGTYTYTQNTIPEPTAIYITIDDKFRTDSSELNYKLNPIRRRLELDIHPSPMGLNIGKIKLGWNKIYEWDFKRGYWVQRNKVKEN